MQCDAQQVKQVAIDALLPDRTYMFFSHVIKAQESNMPLLDTILEKNIRLMDYECIADDDGRRLIAFGKYAGLAGMIDTLRVRWQPVQTIHHSRSIV